MMAISQMLALSATTLALAWLLAGLVRYVRWRLFWFRALRPFPGPQLALPVIGTLHTMVGPMTDIFDRGMGMFHKYGNGSYFTYLSFWLGERPWLHVARPEDLEGLLNSNKHIQKPDVVYKPVSGFFGRGLITLNGDDWRRHRRILTPAFHFGVLERYSGIFVRRAAVFAQKLVEEQADGESFDFMPHIGVFVTDTVMETAFGLQGGEDRDPKEKDDFIEATDTAFHIIANRVMKPWLMLESVFRLSPSGAQQAIADRVINSYAERVINRKRQQIIDDLKRGEQTEDGVDDDGDDGVRKKHTFLDLVLRHQQEVLTDDEILNEVRTLIAVQQTSASTLSFAAVCLALNPEVQKLARKEVMRVNAETSLQPLDRLNRLKYVERVVKEVLRMYPITALFSRTLTEDLLLPTADTKQGIRPVTLPAGLNLTIVPFLTHRDPRHWPEPLRFDPDRFLPEQSAGRHPYAYIPFSAGPRNCIGQRYAMLQMKAVVAALLLQVEILPGDGCERQEQLPLNMNTFLYIKGGFNVRFKRLAPAEE